MGRGLDGGGCWWEVGGCQWGWRVDGAGLDVYSLGGGWGGNSVIIIIFTISLNEIM